MYIFFDIGGTKMRITSFSGGESFGTPIILETPNLYEDGLTLIKKTIKDLSNGGEIQGIVGGIAGPWSDKKASLIGSPNLNDWIGKPFKNNLEDEFQTEVSIENDSAMAGLGEAVYGAGKGFGIVAYITVSTGVGGARIVNGSIDERSIGFEPGHQIIDADKTMITDANGIYLGNYISGHSVEQRTGKKPKEIVDESFWDNLAKILAVGLNNTIVHWSPDVVVLGGSMMNEVGISVEKTEKYLKEFLKIYPEIPEIKKSSLGDFGGLYGALAHLQAKK